MKSRYYNVFKHIYLFNNSFSKKTIDSDKAWPEEVRCLVVVGQEDEVDRGPSALLCKRLAGLARSCRDHVRTLSLAPLILAFIKHQFPAD